MLFGDGTAVELADSCLQKHLDGKGKAVDASEMCGQGGQIIVSVFLAAGGKLLFDRVAILIGHK
ncbi:hypothetical protein D3C72_2528840 [compost metagenome]